VDVEYRVSGQLKILRYLHGMSWVPRIVRVDVEYRMPSQLKIPRYQAEDT
jgi:hypothetical protein